MTDIEIWRLRDADTLKAWRARFEAHLEQVREIYDERFRRMWRFHLVVSELAFRRDLIQRCGAWGVIYRTALFATVLLVDVNGHLGGLNRICLRAVMAS